MRGQRDLVTVVGHAAMISAGEFVQASGSWVSDRKHGVQFKAAFLRAAPPTTFEGIDDRCAATSARPKMAVRSCDRPRRTGPIIARAGG